MTTVPPIPWQTIKELFTGSRSLFSFLTLLIFLGPPAFVSDDWLKKHGLYEALHPYHEWVVVAFWLSLSVLIASLIRWFLQKLMIYWATFSRKRKIRRHLIDMPGDQFAIAMSFGQQDRIALHFPAHRGAIKDFEKRGIVYQAGTATSPIGTLPFVLHDDALEFFTPRGFQKILNERTKMAIKRRG
jgi:superinfection exclusion protein B